MTGHQRRDPLTDNVPLSPAFGLRIGLWYATLFVVGAIANVYVTYT
jgi:hypothetical protein